MKKIKVAYLLQKFPVLSESFIIEEILAMAKNEIEISIFAFEENKEQVRLNEAEELLRRAAFAVNPKGNHKALACVFSANLFFFLRNPLLYLVYFSKYFFKSGKKEFSQIFYLGYLIKKEKATHLHAHFAYLGATAAMVISDFLKIPFSFTVHARDIFIKDEFLGEKIQKAKYVIAISDYNKNYLLNLYPEINPEKIKVIHCGINTEIFTAKEKITQNCINVVSGGRFVEKKGLIYLLRACKILSQNSPAFKCTIFGSGPLNEQLRREAKVLGLEALVDFCGDVNRQSLINLLAKSDIFVLPSIIAEDGDRDGIPVVLMEAMAGGLAVVSTNISGIPELIDSFENGILVEEKNVEALVLALDKLIADRDLRRKLASKARQTIENNFNSAQNITLLADLFKESKLSHDSFFGEPPFKILYINGTAHIGGAEVSLLALLKKIDKKRFMPLVCLPSKGFLFDKLRALGIDVRILALGEFSRQHGVSFLFSVLKLAALFRKEKIDLVHANSIYISEQSLFAARLAGVPCICHVRDLAPVLGAGKIRSIAFRKMNKFIAISEAVKKDLTRELHIPESKIIRIYNGVDIGEFSPRLSGESFRSEFGLKREKLVGMIARFSPEKRQETFLKAAAEVSKAHKDVSFVIVGDAKLGSENYREEMITLSNKLGLQNKTVFTGFRDDLPQVLSALDMLVVPSLAEPFGRVIIEAFACGVPVIAANSGAAGELLTDKYGILFAPDNVKELAGQIERLLRNNLEAQSLAKTAREVVEKNFNIENHVYAIEKLYRETIDKRKRILCKS